MGAPYEIIAAPFTLWIAPVGETFPDVDAAPVGNWAKVGTAGDRNYTDEGVTVQHSQTIEVFRALANTGPVKAFRTQESLLIRANMADVSLEQYAHALNENTVTEAANERKLGLTRGPSVTQRALLLRGPSPYDDDNLNMQYEVPVAIHSGEPEVVFTKGTPAVLVLEFMAMEDPDAASEDERFGRLVADDGET